jgi:hypothetical protein
MSEGHATCTKNARRDEDAVKKENIGVLILNFISLCPEVVPSFQY